jgi:predicted RNase H-like HicB family nuclease
MKVREAISLIEADGWLLVATRGSHRQYKHPTKPGRVTANYRTISRRAPQIAFQASETKGALMRYAIVIEKAGGNYSAYVPDLPGCIAAAATVAEVEQEIRETIRFHIDGLKADGLPIPPPTSIRVCGGLSGSVLSWGFCGEHIGEASQIIG